MRLVCGLWLILVAGFLFLAAPAEAQTVASSTLINNVHEYDNKNVVYQGEVIGDVMARGEFAWVNINDGASAIGVWMPVSFAKWILFKGAYRAKGDWVEVKGVFHRACLQHGGDLDIHAEEFRIIKQGELVREKIDAKERNAAFILMGVLCLALILQLLRKR